MRSDWRPTYRRSQIEVTNPLSEDQSGDADDPVGGAAGRRAVEPLPRCRNGSPCSNPVGVYPAAEGAVEGGPSAGSFPGYQAASGPRASPDRRRSQRRRGAGTWRGERPAPDYFAAKGLVEALEAQLGLELRFEPAAEPFLHPGRSAAVSLDEIALGWVGESNPLVARAWDLQATAGFELDLAPLLEASPAGRERYRDVTTHPAVYEDIAVVVPEDVSADRVREAVTGAGGELLASVAVFDVYRGEQLGEERKSVALRLAFRAPDRTLTDEEVAERREEIRNALGEIGGSLRE